MGENKNSGTIGGKYKILEQSGQGGAGTVFKVYDERLDKIWAAKRVKRTAAGTEEILLGKVDGALFPRIVDVVVEKECKFLIMDWIEGETLQQRLCKSGPYEVREAVRIALLLCEALRSLHEMQPPCLYLDCKPSNVMMDKDGKLWLIDFGSAVVLDGHEAVPLSASPGYSAPEQFVRDERLRRVDARSDVYGLGMTLYALLGGMDPARPPYGACRLTACCPDVPSELCDIVEKSTRKDPALRYQTMSALEKELEEFQKKKEQVPVRKYMAWAGTAAFSAALLWQARNFFKVVQSETAGLQDKISGLAVLIFTAVLSVLWERAAVFLKGKSRPAYEPLQSALRTQKMPGKWMFLALALSLSAGGIGLSADAAAHTAAVSEFWDAPAAAIISESQTVSAATAASVPEAASEPAGRAPVILRDNHLRKLLVKKGTILKTSESVYLELSPECFEYEEEVVLRVSAVGADSGIEYDFELRYCPEGEE